MLPVTKISKIIMNRLDENCASGGEAAGIYGRTWRKNQFKIEDFIFTSAHRSRINEAKSSKNHKINTNYDTLSIKFQTKEFFPFHLWLWRIILFYNPRDRLAEHVQYFMQINCSRNNRNKTPEKFFAFSVAKCIAHTIQYMQKASLIFVNVQLVIRFSGWNFRMPSTRTRSNRWPLSLNSGYMEVIKIGLNNYQLAVYLIRCCS